MADGDIKYVRIPISLDANATADAALQAGVAALFPNAVYPLLHTHIVDITGSNGVNKTVLVVVGRAVS